jgi:hypothetical protein
MAAPSASPSSSAEYESRQNAAEFLGRRPPRARRATAKKRRGSSRGSRWIDHRWRRGRSLRGSGLCANGAAPMPGRREDGMRERVSPLCTDDIG